VRGEAMERETFTAFEFVGMWDKREKVTKSMSLHRFLTYEFIGCGEDDTKALFESYYSRFESKEMSLEDIRKAIAGGTVFFPVTVSCKKKDVMEYIKKGFSVRFVRFTEYKRMLRAYEG
jgi:hypothetical protein